MQALFLLREGSIDSDKLLSALHTVLARHPNVSFTDEHVKKINVQAGRVSSITLSSGETIFAPQILLANGSFAQPLIDQLGDLQYQIPRLVAGTGCSVLIDQCAKSPIQHVLRTPNRAGACGLHAAPRGDGKLYLGATNNVHPSPHFQPSAGLLHFLLRCGMQQINHMLYRSAVHQWYVGNRPAAIDGFPLIGGTPIQGLWMLNGTYRDGLHQSPLLAQHLAAQLLGKEGLFDNWFPPGRLPIQISTKEAAIHEWEKHYIAALYEHGALVFPNILHAHEYEEFIQMRIRKAYQDLDTEFALTPDMLFMFDLLDDKEKVIDSFKNYFAQLALYAEKAASPKASVISA